MLGRVQLKFPLQTSCLLACWLNPARDNASGPDGQAGTGPCPLLWCRGQDTYPHYVAPGAGPHPTCAGARTQSPLLAHSTTMRTRRLTTTIPSGLRLGQSSTAAARSIPGVCVCVCLRSQQHLVGQTRVTLGPLVQPSFDIFFNTAVHAHSTNWFATPL